MTIQAAFDQDPGEQFATNTGWGDFGRWADGLSADAFPRVVHLRDYGWSGELPVLARELAGAVKASPPEAPGLDSLIAHLAELIQQHRDAGAVFVGDGMGPDE